MRWIVLFFLFLSFNQQVLAEKNPFAKTSSLNIGHDVKWHIAGGGATKTASDNKGLFYHLMYDAKQLRLSLSKDESGSLPKKFTQLEVIDVLVDNQRLPLFDWCLNNQSEHNRYLQQGLSVKKDVCVVDGNTGQVTLWLDAATVDRLNQGNELVVVIKPYRSSLNIEYELTDFSEMHSALAEKVSPSVVTAKKQAIKPAVAKKCWAKPPPKNKTLQAIEYTCGEASAKKEAEAVMAKQLADARAMAAKQKQQRAQALALKKKKQAEKLARQKQLAKQRQAKAQEVARATQVEQQVLEGERLLEEQKVAENAVKYSELGVEITGKMVAMCQKYWSKGEHRCYCQRFIEYAPAAIQASASCE